MSPTDLLLIVDIQNDFCPGGALGVAEGDLIIPEVNRLQQYFEHIELTQDRLPRGHLSFASTHAGKKPHESIDLPYGTQVLWPDHCVQGTPGADFHPELNTDKAQLIIRKGVYTEIDSYSAFQENDRKTPTGLTGYLRDLDIRRLFICGLATDFCVTWSALDARAVGMDVVVVEDACKGIDVNGSMEAALAALRKAGVRLVSAGQVPEL